MRDKTEGAAGLGRIATDQIERWNQMTALRFQTGGGEETPEDLASLRTNRTFSKTG